MDIANALWTGVIFGLGYTIFVRAMYRHQLRQVWLFIMINNSSEKSIYWATCFALTIYHGGHVGFCLAVMVSF